MNGAQNVKLGECPVGLFVDDDYRLCFKAQCPHNDGRVRAYVVDTGEAFSADEPLSAKDHNALLVSPVSMERFFKLAEDMSQAAAEVMDASETALELGHQLVQLLPAKRAS